MMRVCATLDSFHHSADTGWWNHLLQLDAHSGAADEFDYRWEAFAGAHRVVLESQQNYDRSCARMHPVPYQAFLPWDDRKRWGDAWFGSRKPREREVSTFFRDYAGKESTGVRTEFAKACATWPGCVNVLDGLAAVNYSEGKIEVPMHLLYFEAAYRGSVFSLQPPGHSAARKGVVDSLLAGAIPVLFAALETRALISSTGHDGPDFISSKDQSNLWPWHWPAQGASAILLEQHQIADLESVLKSVDPEQRHLMRKVIAHQAAGLAWPTNPQQHDHPRDKLDDRARAPNAIDLLMHHLWVAMRQTVTQDHKVGCARWGQADGWKFAAHSRDPFDDDGLDINAEEILYSWKHPKWMQRKTSKVGK